MERYDIQCDRLPEPGQWFFLEDSDHAIRHAEQIYTDLRLIFLFFSQRQDFEDIFYQVKSDPDHDIDKLAFIAFQVQFQRECMEEVWRLFKTRRLSTSP